MDEIRYLGRTMFVIQTKKNSGTAHYTHCLHRVHQILMEEAKLSDKTALYYLNKANEMRTGESFREKDFAIHKATKDTYNKVNFYRLYEESSLWV